MVSISVDGHEQEPRGWLRPKTLRHLLGGLLAAGAVNAFVGGYYGMAGAKGLPTDWLDLGPFDDYFLPA